jgi:hypothetical protein
LSSSWDGRRRQKTLNREPAAREVVVKLRETVQRAETSPARGEGESAVGSGSVWAYGSR